MNLKNELKKTKEDFRKEKYELFQKFISEKAELNRQIHQLKDQINMIKKEQKQSSSTYKSKRTEIFDVLFVVDALNLRGNDLKAAFDHVEDKAFDLSMEYRRRSFKFALICYKNTVEFPDEWPRIFDLDEEIENLAEFGENIIENHLDVTIDDSTCDFVSTLYHAFNDLSWRDGQKMIC